MALFWHDCCTAPGNCINLSITSTLNIIARSIKSCLQCTCTSSVHRVAC
uniref:Uncharacterized protein n=1 Tax=Arundo donax TaxID=35708 RepID=A0A0A9AKS2_ARUDO